MSSIFIADDDPLMSRMYERAFKFAGHKVTIAQDGESALATLKSMEPKPAAALLDVMMPKMSGFDLLHAMKADAVLSRIPAVLLTNLAGKQDAEKGIKLGASLYLIKSEFNPRQIVEKIESLIQSLLGEFPKASLQPLPPDSQRSDSASHARAELEQLLAAHDAPPPLSAKTIENPPSPPPQQKV